MNKKRLLKIWYGSVFGITGTLSVLIFLWGVVMVAQPRVEVDAIAHKDPTASGTCIYYFTFSSEGQDWTSEPENYYGSRSGCPLEDGEIETIYHKPGDPLDFTRSGKVAGVVVILMFGLVAVSCPVAIRKKWTELESAPV